MQKMKTDTDKMKFYSVMNFQLTLKIKLTR